MYITIPLPIYTCKSTCLILSNFWLGRKLILKLILIMEITYSLPRNFAVSLDFVHRYKLHYTKIRILLRSFNWIYPLNYSCWQVHKNMGSFWWKIWENHIWTQVGMASLTALSKNENMVFEFLFYPFFFPKLLINYYRWMFGLRFIHHMYTTCTTVHVLTDKTRTSGKDE